MKILKYFLLLSVLIFAGCRTTSPSVKGESRQESISAMEKVVGAVAGQEVTEKDLRELEKRAQKDPETRSALETISNSMSGQGDSVRYCPVDGERYSPKFLECPVHHVPLKVLTE